jgi:hypothetical protein
MIRKLWIMAISQANSLINLEIQRSTRVILELVHMVRAGMPPMQNQMHTLQAQTPTKISQYLFDPYLWYVRTKTRVKIM